MQRFKLFILQKWDAVKVEFLTVATLAGDKLAFARDLLEDKAKLIEKNMLQPSDLIDPFEIRSLRVETQVENRPRRQAAVEDVVLNERFPFVDLTKINDI
jgi:hypothetical protein